MRSRLIGRQNCRAIDADVPARAILTHRLIRRHGVVFIATRQASFDAECVTKVGGEPGTQAAHQRVSIFGGVEQRSLACVDRCRLLRSTLLISR